MRTMETKYLICKVTNLVNGMVWVGAHKTKNEFDSYLGSGKRMNRALKKYGRKNFSKEILFRLNSEEGMYAKEAEIVSEEFHKEAITYNIKPAGEGVFSIQPTKRNISARKKGRLNLKAKVISKETQVYWLYCKNQNIWGDERVLAEIQEWQKAHPQESIRYLFRGHRRARAYFDKKKLRYEEPK